jgi:F-type H+-transporting ATPase subunit gamma
MASMRDIKRRKESVQSTQQITKAMKLVSTVKLQRAKGRAESAKPYFDKMFATVTSILEKAESLDHPYLVDNGSPKNAVIVISGNRGLAGGYNNNIVKEVMEQGLTPDNTVIYGVGKKGVEFLRRRGYEIVSETNDMIDEPKFEDAAFLGKTLLEAYEKGEIGKIYIAYTRFKNTVVHIPTVMQLLPVEVTAEQKAEGTSEAPMNFEPEPEAALELIVPKYINSLIYGAFVESVASENGARMQAMDSATSNADEIIATLSLAYNRARQGAITQELTEIISGAEALG